MKNNKSLNFNIILIIIFLLVVLVVGGAVYFDLTSDKQDVNSNETANNDETTPAQGDEISFIPYQSADSLYEIQVPDFWNGEERAGAAIFYSYNPAEAEPEQRAKIEIGRAANAEMLPIIEWLNDKEVDLTNAQQVAFGDIPGVMILLDNTADNTGDIKSTIYMPANDQVLVITSESFGGSRDVAIQFFNAILNSWKWTTEVTSPDLLMAAEAVNQEVSETENVDMGDTEVVNEATDEVLNNNKNNEELPPSEELPLSEEQPLSADQPVDTLE